MSHRTVLFMKSTMILLLALAVGLAAAGPAAANSKYAAIVVDANTGKTLFASSADAPRYPASLTKMMTLYMVFEAMQSGRISKNTPVPFSKNAAAEPPTKLGVKVGGSISVETAIRALVTRSANDVATAVAELLGGSEEKFAQMMTAKARSLGMSSTTFRNAHGLPNTAQKTTARDMATLSIALREHFPTHYAYFSTQSFSYGKQRIRTHNRMFGRIKGVDGIKTGYTRASGFNLATSVQSGGRSVVAVVLGGRSGRSRDDHMAELLRTYLPKASTRDSGPLVAKADVSPFKALASAFLPKKDAPTPVFRPREDVTVAALQEAAPAALPADPEPVVVEQGYAEPDPARMADIDLVRTASIPSGWAVQVASSPSEVEARAFLHKTGKQASSILAHASGYTVTFEKGGVTYYRARFGGFGSKDAAWNACDALKKKRIDCYAVQQ